jgi:hypothetical protein
MLGAIAKTNRIRRAGPSHPPGTRPQLTQARALLLLRTQRPQHLCGASQPSQAAANLEQQKILIDTIPKLESNVTQRKQRTEVGDYGFDKVSHGG